MYRVYMIAGPSGKKYIGITGREVAARFARHVVDAAAGSNLALHRAMRKYGAGAFTVRVLTECVDKREAIACERGLIAQYGTYAHGGAGYNLTIGGEGVSGHKASPETRAALRAFRLGKKRAKEDVEKQRATMSARDRARYRSDPEFRAEIERRLRSPEAKAKGVAAMTAKMVEQCADPQHRAGLIARLQSGKGPDWKMPESAKEKLRQANLGKKWSPEAKEKLRATMALSRDERSRQQKGRPRSPESIAKQKATMMLPENREKRAARVREQMRELEETGQLVRTAEGRWKRVDVTKEAA